MIYFLTTGHSYTVGYFLNHWGKQFADLVACVTYLDFLAERHHPAGMYVFADLERLSPDQKTRVASRWEMLERSRSVTSLNHPRLSMCRYELLRTLHERGINSFNVYHLDSIPHHLRFPVFLRRANGHYGNETALIYEWQTLAEEITRIKEKAAYTNDEWIAVEYLDSGDENGVFRKYSSFIVDGAILPVHLFCGYDWSLKDNTKAISKSFIEEEWRYVSEDPHRVQLLEIFKIAQIGYGRIDYSLTDGKIQVWEINTNPIILNYADSQDVARSRVHQFFSTRFDSALMGLIRKSPNGAAITIPAWTACRSKLFILKGKLLRKSQSLLQSYYLSCQRAHSLLAPPAESPLVVLGASRANSRQP